MSLTEGQAGGLSAGGGLIRTIGNWVMARRNKKFASAEAEKQRNWQEKMSNTQYQRSINDMRKAGLNPSLAYGQGGASVGGGASASAPGTGDTGNPVDGVVSSAMDIKRTKIQKDMADKQLKLLGSQLNKTQQEAVLTQLKQQQQKLINSAQSWNNDMSKLHMNKTTDKTPGTVNTANSIWGQIKSGFNTAVKQDIENVKNVVKKIRRKK